MGGLPVGFDECLARGKRVAVDPLVEVALEAPEREVRRIADGRAAGDRVREKVVGDVEDDDAVERE